MQLQQRWAVNVQHQMFALERIKDPNQ